MNNMLNIQLSLPQFVLMIYLLIINLIVFFVYGLDKIKAPTNSRRVSERMLWFLALIGGSVGAIVSMHIFRHKTKKLSFQALLAVIILAQVWLVAWLWKLKTNVL